jgi:hypothetical protein
LIAVAGEFLVFMSSFLLVPAVVGFIAVCIYVRAVAGVLAKGYSLTVHGLRCPSSTTASVLVVGSWILILIRNYFTFGYCLDPEFCIQDPQF